MPHARCFNAVVSGADSTLRMANGRVRLPDLKWCFVDRLAGGAVPNAAIPTIAPHVVGEVLSPGNTTREIQQKLREYFASGTILAWIIDPATRSVAIHRDADRPSRHVGLGQTLDGEDVIPGFSMPEADLFRNIPT